MAKEETKTKKTTKKEEKKEEKNEVKSVHEISVVIEGKEYFLESGDVIIVRKHEMHRMYHNSNAKYHRMILMVNPEFFINHNCPACTTSIFTFGCHASEIFKISDILRELGF